MKYLYLRFDIFFHHILGESYYPKTIGTTCCVVIRSVCWALSRERGITRSLPAGLLGGDGSASPFEGCRQTLERCVKWHTRSSNEETIHWLQRDRALEKLLVAELVREFPCATWSPHTMPTRLRLFKLDQLQPILTLIIIIFSSSSSSSFFFYWLYNPGWVLVC